MSEYSANRALADAAPCIGAHWRTPARRRTVRRVAWWRRVLAALRGVL